MATNEELATTLEDLADLLQARGELIFKLRAYRKAAAALRNLGVPLEEYQREHSLREISGVGEAIAKKLDGMLEQGPEEWLQAYLARLDEQK